MTDSTIVLGSKAILLNNGQPIHGKIVYAAPDGLSGGFELPSGEVIQIVAAGYAGIIEGIYSDVDNMMHNIKSQMSSILGKDKICDFCSTPFKPDTYVTLYPCKSTFILSAVDNKSKYESQGDWAACDDCHTLIESKDLQGLVTRVVPFIIKKHYPDPSQQPDQEYIRLFTETIRRQYVEFMKYHEPGKQMKSVNLPE